MATPSRSLTLAAWIGISATCISAVAQQQVTVPATAAAADAASAFVLAGVTVAGRQQVLIDAAHLEPGQLGATWTAIEFRRDAGWTDALRGGVAQLEVWLGPSQRAANEASPRFADNRSPASMVQVFAGNVQIPGSPAVDARANDWSHPNDVISIQFTTPYAYSGGDVCIEVSGAPLAGSEPGFWGVDAVNDGAVGHSNSYGAGCGGMQRAYVHERSLVAGATATFYAVAEGHVGGGAILFGASTSPIDLDATGLALAGCALHVVPFATMPTSFAANQSHAMSTAKTSLQLPADVGVLAQSIAFQFVAMSAPLEFSPAVLATIAATVPTLGMATVHASQIGATLPSEGKVWSNRAPVLRLVR